MVSTRRRRVFVGLAVALGLAVGLAVRFPRVVDRLLAGTKPEIGVTEGGKKKPAKRSPPRSSGRDKKR